MQRKTKWILIGVLLIVIAFDLNIIQLGNPVNTLNKYINTSNMSNARSTVSTYIDNTTRGISNFGDAINGKSSEYNLSYNIISIGGRAMPTKIKSADDIIVCDVIIKSTTNRNIYNVTLADTGDMSELVTGAHDPVESLHPDKVLEPNETWVYHINSHVRPENAFDNFYLYFEVTGDGVNTLRESTDCLSSNFSSYTPMKDSNTYWVGGDGHNIVLRNNDDAKDPTYNELVDFILRDNTDKRTYSPGSFVCADFAETVHNNAEAQGIKAGWVTIDFVEDSRGHVCNVFNTTDRGLVFIDCTSSYPPSGGDWDSTVNLEIGSEYIPHHINSYDNSYYDSMGIVSNYRIYW